MKKLTVLLLVLIVGLAGIGLWRGWFSVSSQRRPDAGKVDVNLSVDTDKVKEDAATVKEKAAELTDKVTEEARELGGKAKESVKEDPDR